VCACPSKSAASRLRPLGSLLESRTLQRGRGTTALGTRYHKENGDVSIPGNQHTASVLDNSIFSDFKQKRGLHIAATFDVPIGHPDKISMATPALGQDCFERVWPTILSKRIIEDFDRWPTSIQGIVDIDGCVFEPEKGSGAEAARLAWALGAPCGGGRGQIV